MAGKQKKQDKALSAPERTPGGAATAAASGPGEKIARLGRYFEDARAELGKVSWPTKQEVKAAFFAVTILVVVMAFFLGIADLLLSKLMEAILSIGL